MAVELALYGRRPRSVLLGGGYDGLVLQPVGARVYVAGVVGGRTLVLAGLEHGVGVDEVYPQPVVAGDDVGLLGLRAAYGGREALVDDPEFVPEVLRAGGVGADEVLLQEYV